MNSDHTQHQSTEDERLARELSLRHSRPPTQVPGYELTQFLGAGAYGEVWIGLDRSTGRQVAVKFYLYRGSVDWTLLSREVEKLVFLSADRYVVQLLDVGWEADPPYYVMEYIENGSLEQLIQREGRRPLNQAVELFREIAMGLNHAHAKGVLHCDLKPGNVLLDQDAHPRLADFGQSRLAHEQAASLGTLFYMAPEQADLKAVPDARWDVYALGAIFYCMLLGSPPFQNDEILSRIESARDLPERLARYRNWIESSPRPQRHRQLQGVDHALADIISRCLEVEPSKRYANVQEVLDALRARDQARYRRPLLLLGILGPLLLMVVMGIYGYRGYKQAVDDSRQVVTEKVQESNSFAAKFVASSVATEIERYFRAVGQTAASLELVDQIILVTEQLDGPLAVLADPQTDVDQREEIRQEFESHPLRSQLQARVQALLESPQSPEGASWFVCDAWGTHLAGAFDRQSVSTIGDNFAYRTYCHGGARDLPRGSRPLPTKHVQRTQMSAPLLSLATQTFKIAVSRPLYDYQHGGRFLGVLVLTVEVGNFLKFNASNPTESRFAVLVDGRNNGFRGAILHHPLFSSVFEEKGKLPERFSRYRVPLDKTFDSMDIYRDPLGQDVAGEQYACPWIAARSDVRMQSDTRGKDEQIDTGLIVLVQEEKQAAMHPLKQLSTRLAREGLFALATILSVVFLLWYFVLRVLGEPHLWSSKPDKYFPAGSSRYGTVGSGRASDDHNAS